jgi:hypothetical protein
MSNDEKDIADAFVNAIAGSMGHGVAAVARVVKSKLAHHLERFAVECETATIKDPGCCAGDFARSSAGAIVYIHASECRRNGR